MILSLDISTSCTGYCIFSDTGRLVHFGAVDMSKEKSFFKKVDILQAALENLFSEFDIEVAAIEESLQSFRSGFSSARTLFTLSKFNGIVQYICYKKGIEITTYNVNSARKLASIKIDRKSKTTTKEQVAYQVEEIEKSLVLPRKLLKSGPRKGLEVYQNASYDIADAYVIGKAYCVEKCI